MCGIAAFINFSDGDLQKVNVAKIQQHRGPDSQQEWRHKNVVLSQQRLSIIDLDKRADQPFIKGGLAIIFNGEIYNYKELRNEILNEDRELCFVTTSDTEVLLELYRLKGEKCLDNIVGMFSFAIYEIATGKLFLARDHFGIKPLFYTKIGNAFAFASELKTLTKLPGFNKTINKNSLVGSLNYLWVPGNETMFKECFKLPAAHLMEIETRADVINFNCKSFWSLATSITHTDEAKTIIQLTDAIEKSVHRHMIADVPVSSFLSGGLDSSLISVIAAQTNSKLSTYTISQTAEDKKVEQMPEDEKYARVLAEKFNFDHNEILINANILSELPFIVKTLDEPIGDPAAINTYLICKAAREKGVKVLLSGMGADEIFFGYRRQKATLLSLQFKKIPYSIRRAFSALLQLLPVKLFGRGIKLTRWAKRFEAFMNFPVEEAYMRSYSYYSEDELQNLFRENINLPYKKIRDYHQGIFNHSYFGDPINQICYTDIFLFMQGLNLTYTDRASMAASVEVRVPFIDKEVVETAMQIDGKLKYKNGESKYILKKVAEKYLPKDIIYRPKASFGAPIRSWISGQLKGVVDELLSQQATEKRGLFNYSYIKKLIDDDRKGVADNAYRIYHLLTVELWFRHFVDEQA